MRPNLYINILKLFITTTLITPLLVACGPKSDSETKTQTETQTVANGPVVSDMAYNYQAGSNGVTWILIHGLGDDMTKLNGLAQLAIQRGYGILQMDLYGHGLTLQNYLQTHSKLPESFDYRDNVVGIKRLLEQLSLTDRLVIVGHSYGGAIAYALASAIESDASSSESGKLLQVHLLAPYVQRLDKSIAQIFNPFNIPSVDSYNNAFLDPILEQYMRRNFRTYLSKSNYGVEEYQLTKERLRELDIRVEAAILVTKGIRSFDLLDEKAPFVKIQTPINIIGGASDTLVKPEMLRSFDTRLTAAGNLHQLQFIEGMNSDHLFPQTNAQITFEKILQFH